jgi:hypothetical protein
MRYIYNMENETTPMTLSPTAQEVLTAAICDGPELEYRIAAQPYELPEIDAKGPTDEELLAMRSWSSHSHTFDSDLVDFARAVLARWGQP